MKVENKSQTPNQITAVQLLGLDVLHADTEIARHNHAVAAHSGAKLSSQAQSSTQSAHFEPSGAFGSKNSSNFIALTSVSEVSNGAAQGCGCGSDASNARSCDSANSDGEAALDLATVRAKLAAAQGPTYWRGLEELSGDPKFQDLVDREFGRQAPASWAPVSRRDFLKVMGAGLALAGLSGCAFQPQEKIVPYVKAPEEIVPGKPLFYATALPVGGGFVNGVLAESNMGRPTKIEGNEKHPASLGATDIFMQAAILSMYDPERLQNVTYRGNVSTWENFAGAMEAERRKLSINGGAGLRVLTDGVTSPTLVAQMAALKKAFPQSQWISYEPVNADNALEGARLAFGRAVHTVCRFDKAQRILSLDSDFLFEDAARVRYSRDFISGRRITGDKNGKTRDAMNRLYVAESTPTITGSMADHRLPLRAAQVETLARLILSRTRGENSAVAADLPQDTALWVTALVKDLQANRGASLVVAGAQQPPAVHAIAHALNDALGNVGKTLYYTELLTANAANQTRELATLASDMNAGRVQTLLIIGGNPAFEAPADLNFVTGLKRVPTIVRLSTQSDETAFQSQWVLPEAHALEAWSDGRSFEGTTSIVQPLIAPLYENARSAHELLAVFLNAPLTNGYDIVENYWRSQLSGDFEKTWQTILHDGLVPNTAAKATAVALNAGFLSAIPTASPISSTQLEVTFRPDPTIWDGRWANSAWLQELPKPLTRLTWDNVALLSLNTATDLKVTNEDLVSLKVGNRSVSAPVFVMPGQPDGSVAVHLGGGRTHGGKLLQDVGFDSYQIRTSQAMGFASGLQVTKLPGTRRLASVEDHHIISASDAETDGDVKRMNSMQNRDLIRVGEFDEYQKNPRYMRGEFDQYIQYGEAGTASSTAGAREGAKAATGEKREGAEAEAETGLPTLYNNGWPSDPKGLGADGLPIYTTRKSTSDPDEAEARTKYNDPHVQFGYNDQPLPQWAMTIDLNSCIGCNACTIGCQAENNIATVGKDQVLNRREMHWIRIDTYFKGDVRNPQSFFQPVPCMHCEKAPCEPVCPVEATSHSAEGINEMTYNRCVGTKYCSNNCPYKVRRFNFLQYTDLDTPQIKLQQNPDVTVRARGVMEKCTYCIQRVTQARIEAEREDRPMRDGEVISACQQACPTDAIVFGNLADMKSYVRQTKAHPLNYAILSELGTQPRTTYLARLRNTNPELRALEAKLVGNVGVHDEVLHGAESGASEAKVEGNR